MSSWREDRMYEIMHRLWDNPVLQGIYEKEMNKESEENPNEEFFHRMERCYEKALKEYENL